MRSYDERETDEGDALDRDDGGGPRLPGGISVQTAGAALLIVVVVAVLWLLAAPEAEQPSDLPTATSVAVGAGVASAPPMTGTLATGRATGGTPVSGAAVAMASTATAAAPRASTVAPGATLGSATTAPPAGNLAEGTFAKVSGTGVEGISFRWGPGLNYARIRVAFDGDVMLVLGGPESADGFSWWRLQDDLGNIGWAADAFLTPIAAPVDWSPPEASPTFAAATGGAEGEMPVLTLPTP